MNFYLTSSLLLLCSTSVALAQAGRCDESNGCRATTESERSLVGVWRKKVESLVKPVPTTANAQLSAVTVTDDKSAAAYCMNFSTGCFPRVENAWRSGAPHSKLSANDIFVRAILSPMQVDVCAAALGMSVLSRAEGMFELIKEDEADRATYILALGEVTCSQVPKDEAAAVAARSRVVEPSKAGRPARFLAPPVALVVLFKGPKLEIERYRLRASTIAIGAPLVSDKLSQLQLATAHIDDGFFCERSAQCLRSACVSGVCGGAAGVKARRERICRENPSSCEAPPTVQEGDSRPVQRLGAVRAGDRGSGCIYDSQCGTGRCSGGVCSNLGGPSYMKSHSDFMSDYFKSKY